MHMLLLPGSRGGRRRLAISMRHLQALLGLIPKNFLDLWLGDAAAKSSSVELRSCNGCVLTVRMRILEDGKAYFQDGWSHFVNAHQLQVGSFLVFKPVESFLKVVILDGNTMVEKVSYCK
ncbi:hypothetical protein BRADI_3g24441v3 [Brachypodium distachyon]|uniref:TF-B3 domain-containing protein n=1 Tax=Brachypodium distachyon TaxID=15368 RepID=A0A2K2CZ60_BRADI|nr:hypothetical protein BRADI_3g24441v3 [Brachypodium distachyon]PNT67310.1 hypothetical protein BRADI_3g24441v3 [Brachypodium distachyon]